MTIEYTQAPEQDNLGASLALVPVERALTPVVVETESDSAVGSAVGEAMAQIRRTCAEFEQRWFDLGVWLNVVREGVAPGAFLAFLEEVNIEERWAQRAMRIAKEGADLRVFGFTKADLLLRLKQPERAEFLRQHDVALMSSRKLERVIAAMLAEKRPAKAPKGSSTVPPAGRLTQQQVWALGVHGIPVDDVAVSMVEDRHKILAKLFAKRPELRESLTFAKAVLDEYFATHATDNVSAAA